MKASGVGGSPDTVEARASVLSWGGGRFSALQRAALTAGSMAAALVLGLLLAGLAWLPLGPVFVVVTLSVFTAVSLLAWRGLAGHGHVRFGAANYVTSIRAGLVSVTAGAVASLSHIAPDAPALWTLIGLVAFAFALDGLDGHLARRQGLESDFGAQFDMEIDALLILILSIAAVLLDKVGPWVLIMGLIRYAFVAAAFAMPRLRDELPPSLRRKLVCVLQIAVLCAILLPFVTPGLAAIAAVPALAALIYSFAVDILYLLHHSRKPA